ncbi:MAG: hypothetical protein RR201_03185 [Malacoplasma sp.]
MNKNKQRSIENMTQNEIVLTFISVIGTISSILFAYLAFHNSSKLDEKKRGKNEGVLLSNVEYIKSSIDRIEKNLDKLQSKYDDLHTRLVMVEEKMINHIENENIHLSGGK